MLLDPVECPDGQVQHAGIFRLAVQGGKAVECKSISVRPLLVAPSLAFGHSAAPAARLIKSAVLGVPHHVAEKFVTMPRDREIQTRLAGELRDL